MQLHIYTYIYLKTYACFKSLLQTIDSPRKTGSLGADLRSERLPSLQLLVSEQASLLMLAFV